MWLCDSSFTEKKKNNAKKQQHFAGTNPAVWVIQSFLASLSKQKNKDVQRISQTLTMNSGVQR